jgi:transcription elongation GreA/GreB family factor
MSSRRTPAPSVLPDRARRAPAMAEPLLTPDGRVALGERLALLRAELADLGPLLAEPDLDRRLDDRYHQLWQDIEALDGLLAEAGVLPVGEPDVVCPGSLVEVGFPGVGVERLRIVHPAEAVLDDERVSADAPVARALLGRRPGEAVTYDTPRGTVSCVVLAVHPLGAQPDPQFRYSAAGEGYPSRVAENWTFLSNHGRVLLTIAEDPDVRLRDIAVKVGITERAAQMIVGDLEEAGYLSKHREGRRNHYVVHARKAFRHPHEAGHKVGELLAIFTG